MFHYFASSPRYIEDLLAHELRELGAREVKIGKGGVHFQGDLETGLRSCLWSRTASRILLELIEFPMEQEEQLYQELEKYPWEELFSVEKNFACRFTSRGRAPMDPRMGSLHIKDAIADRFRKIKGVRPNVERDHPEVLISGHWDKNHCSIYLDLSGEPLSNRNYRTDSGVAPIRENLAAALLIRSRWLEIREAGGAFWDPLCGSGTLVIEAAMIASDQAPGLKRTSWGFQHWASYDSQLWEGLIQEAESRARAGKKGLPPMGGSDNNRKVLQKARDNAGRAGLNLNFMDCALEDLPRNKHDWSPRGLLLTNPPYGKRLDEKPELESLYSLLGQFYRENLPDWQLSLITTDKDLSFATGLRSDRIHKFDNGPLNCELSHFTEPEKNRFVFHLSDSGEQFKNRLQKNYKRIRRWAKKHGVSCYRLYDADLPDYNFALDFYEKKWVHLQEYVPPKTIDGDKAEKRIREAVTVISELLEIPKASVFLKQRKQQKGKDQYNRQNEGSERYLAHEHDYSCWVNFQDYLDTGIFLDHRPVRGWIRSNVKDQWFLNLFCYTATASVAAAQGEARLTVSVDTSTTYLDWGKDNFRLNHQFPEDHEFVKADVMSWLEKERRSFHVIFVDPPTFSNNRTQKRIFDIQKDHIDLLRLCYRRLRPGGMLIFSNNFRKFEMEFKAPADGEMEEITEWSIPEDFRRGKRIHRCWMIKKGLNS